MSFSDFAVGSVAEMLRLNSRAAIAMTDFIMFLIFMTFISSP